MFKNLVILILSILWFTGCGRNPKEQVAINLKASELVKLKIRRVEGTDRAFSESVTGTSVKNEKASFKEISPLWDSERVSGKIQVLIKKMLLTKGNEKGLFSEDFRGMPLVPNSLSQVISRPNGISSWEEVGVDDWLGKEQFVRSLEKLSQVFSEGTESKVVEIIVKDSLYETELSVDHYSERKEAHATWKCRWERDPNGSMRLLEVKRENYVEMRSKRRPIYVDATINVIGDTPHYYNQVARGVSEWAGVVTRFGDLSLTGHHGIAVGDVNGDGRDDLFVCDGGSLPNRLYEQKEDGTVKDVSKSAGIDWYEDSRAALLLDLDNDGDQDLVVATIAMVVFAENNGRGQFTIKGGFPGAQYPFSLSSSDYDLDGDLDIYVCVYGEGDSVSGARGFDERAPVPFHDAQNGGANVMLENLGSFKFFDVTESVGLDKGNSRWSFSASWEDFDGDGDSDLYVANDFGRNCLYLNEEGQFQEISKDFTVEDTGAGMSVSWGDYNRDGQFDIYVGNMFSAAGRRVGNQSSFAPDRNRSAVKEMRRMSQGNSLYRGGKKGFTETAEELGVSMARWAWSSGFVDVDNDGWEDLVVTNGYLTGWEKADDL